MGEFVVRPWDEIINGVTPKEGELRKSGFVHALEDLRRKHGKVLTIEELPEHRKYPAQFLNKARELLIAPEIDLMKLLCESDRQAVLEIVEQEQRNQLLKGIIFTGLCTLVAAEICATYKESILDPNHVEGTSATFKGGLIEDGSEFFRGLLASVGRTTDNEMSFERMQTFMQTANNFISTYVYVEHEHLDKQSSLGFREKHEFSDIQNLDVGKYLELSCNIIHEASLAGIKRNSMKLADDKRIREQEELKRAQEEHKAQLERVKEEQRKLKEEQRLARELERKGESSWSFSDYIPFYSSPTSKPAPTATPTVDSSNTQENTEHASSPTAGLG